MSRCRAEGSSRTCWRHRKSNAGPSCLMSAASLSRSFMVLKPQADAVQRAFAPYYPASDDRMRGIRTTSGPRAIRTEDVLVKEGVCGQTPVAQSDAPSPVRTSFVSLNRGIDEFTLR